MVVRLLLAAGTPPGKAAAFEEAWTRQLLAPDAPPVDGATGVVSWVGESEWASLTAFQAALTADVPLFVVGATVLAVYVVTFFGDFHSLRSRAAVGAGALLSVALATVSAYGVASAAGLFYGPVHSLLPLLLLGIGVDDAFIVAQALDDGRVGAGRRDGAGGNESDCGSNEQAVTDSPGAINASDGSGGDSDSGSDGSDGWGRGSGVHENDSSAVRVARAVSTAGTSIFVTSVTNVAVFAFSASTRLPALRSFCWWAALGVAFDFVFTLLFLVPLLVLDERRMAARRRDGYCCWTLAPPRVVAKATNVCGLPSEVVRRALRDHVAPVVLHRVGRWIVLAAFAAAAVVGAIGTARLRLNDQFHRYIPADSTTGLFLAAYERQFGHRVTVGVFVGAIDYPAATSQRALAA
eukprot:contig_18198_g4457